MLDLYVDICYVKGWVKGYLAKGNFQAQNIAGIEYNYDYLAQDFQG